MKKLTRIALCAAIALTLTALQARAEDIFTLNFEKPEDAQAIVGKNPVDIAEPGFQSPKCAGRTTTGKYGSFDFIVDKEVKPGMKIAFDYKVDVTAGEVSYVALSIFTNTKKRAWKGFSVKNEWTHVEMAIDQVPAPKDSEPAEPLAPGDTIAKVQIYSRGKDDAAQHTIQLDNVRIFTD